MPDTISREVNARTASAQMRRLRVELNGDELAPPGVEAADILTVSLHLEWETPSSPVRPWLSLGFLRRDETRSEFARMDLALGDVVRVVALPAPARRSSGPEAVRAPIAGDDAGHPGIRIRADGRAVLSASLEGPGRLTCSIAADAQGPTRYVLDVYCADSSAEGRSRFRIWRRVEDGPVEAKTVEVEIARDVEADEPKWLQGLGPDEKPDQEEP